MKNIKELTIEEMKAELVNREKERKSVWEQIGVKVTVGDTFVWYHAKDKAEVQKVLSSFEPYRDMGEIKTSGKTYYTTEPTRYRIDCNQDINNVKLKISFGLLNMDVHLDIPYESLPKDIKDMFEVGTRKVSDTEYHYFPATSQRELNEIRLRAFYPPHGIEVINWYKSDRTILNTNFINRIINKFNEQ